MHLFVFSFYAAGVLYAIFQQPSLIFYFLFFVGGYMVISACYPGAKNISTRKKLMLGTWTTPSEGVIQVKVKVRTENVEKLIQQSPQDQKLSLTHFVLKGIGELLHEGPDMNGKLVFGKFVPYEKVNVSCLVNLDGGKDLAMVLVEDIDNKSVEQIAQFIRSKTKAMQKGKGGDSEHKKRIGAAKMIPAFMVTILLEVAAFIGTTIGIAIPAVAMKKNQFGAACVTALGAFGFEDALAPFSGFTKCTMFVSICSTHEEPVVENGRIDIGRIMNVNFAMDHRYIDGGKSKSFVKIFKQLFDEPELYLKKSGPDRMKKE